MKTLIVALCAVLMLHGTPVLAGTLPNTSPKTETADSVKAAMKDEVEKLKLQMKDQAIKLRAQQKEQRDKLKADQKQQLAKLKSDQKARWQKFQAQLAANDNAAPPAKSGRTAATGNP